MHVTLEKYYLRESYFEVEIRCVECGHMFSLYFRFYFVTRIGISLTTWLKHGNLHKRFITEHQQEGLIPMFLLHNKLEEMNSSELVVICKLNESNVLNNLNFSILESKLSVTK